ncbi:dephospho-CoA kinase [bacterium]|nr:dephospho-CoA kinase [bacterium]
MVIGVTGNPGAGKTTFSRELASRGGCLINVDHLAHSVLAGDPGVVGRLAAVFGPGVAVNGRIDRTALAELAFADSARLRDLTDIVWPPMLALLDRTIADMKANPDCRYIVADMAVLFECGAEDRFDRVITVVAPDERRYRRLHRERGWSRDEFHRRDGLQLSQESKASRSHLVITNDSTPAALREKSRACFLNLFGLHF